jgi:hypothetical protein
MLCWPAPLEDETPAVKKARLVLERIQEKEASKSLESNNKFAQQIVAKLCSVVVTTEEATSSPLFDQVPLQLKQLEGNSNNEKINTIPLKTSRIPREFVKHVKFLLRKFHENFPRIFT